jgi:hypothetical protein
VNRRRPERLAHDARVAQDDVTPVGRNGVMTDRRLDLDDELLFLQTLVESHANVAGDILQISATAWALHGSIPVDGEVLVAQYGSREAASDALARLTPNFGP